MGEHSDQHRDKSTDNTDSTKAADERRKRRGRLGEEAAAKFYQQNGFTILERNFRAGRYEIDLIVRKENLIVFVEVKTAAGPAFGHPAERVDDRKQQRIITVARHYLLTKSLTDVDLRLDVVTFVGDRLEHYPDAFRTDERDD